jgi:hypothetical protein
VAQTNRVTTFFHAEIKGREGHFAGDGQTLRPGRKYVFPWVPHYREGFPSLAEARKCTRVSSFYDLFDHSHPHFSKLT